MSKPPHFSVTADAPQLVQQLPGGAFTVSVYANQVRMGVTLTDFTIVFGITEATPAGTMTVDRAVVHLSPGTLKQLLMNVDMAVDAYERVVGEIVVPKRLTAQIENVKKKLISNLHQQLEGGSPSTTG